MFSKKKVYDSFQRKERFNYWLVLSDVNLQLSLNIHGYDAKHLKLKALLLKPNSYLFDSFWVLVFKKAVAQWY